MEQQNMETPVLEEQNLQKESKEKKTGFFRPIPVFILEIFALLISIGVLYVVNVTTSRVAHTDIGEDKIEVNEYVAIKLQEQKNNIEALTGKKSKGYRTVALFGVDARDGQLDSGTRTDTIIIASLNQDTDEVKLVSVYRDTILNIGNDRYRKCNEAYAIGGPEQALTMLNKNLDLNITDYVTVGFLGLIDSIDALGGVEIDVQMNEICHINNYQLCMSQELDKEYSEVYETGMQSLDGMQATAYCRIRYTTGWDFKRTQRQRDVLSAMLTKAKTVSASKLANTAVAIMPHVSTSLSIEDVLSVVGSVYNVGLSQSEGFPAASNIWTGNLGGSIGSSVVPVDLTQNVRLLHQILYDEEDYEPSDVVKEYSQKIQELAAPYMY